MAHVPSVAQTQRKLGPFASAARKLAVASRSCAYCGSLEIRPSDRRNALDILLACVFLAPYRCRFCRLRFYRVWRRGLRQAPDSAELGRLQPEAFQPADPIQPPSGQQPPPAVSPGPILILENDPSIRKLLCRLLARRGHLTAEVSQPGDLAEELRHRRSDLLIVDVSAVGGVNVEAVHALAHLHPNLKILALSTESLNGDEIPDRLLALPKPFPLDSFVQCVDRLLERSSPPQ